MYYGYSYKESLKDPVKDLKDFIVKGLTSTEDEVSKEEMTSQQKKTCHGGSIGRGNISNCCIVSTLITSFVSWK